MDKRRGDKVVLRNRRARHDYHVLDTFEAGVVLVGSEVKSIRDSRANLQDAYARVIDGEVWLYGMHVAPYPFAHTDPPDPTRRRKLLLHRKEIIELERATNEKGFTVIPLEVYLNEGRVKIRIGIARGKAHYDKRQSLAARDAQREAERALKSWRD